LPQIVSNRRLTADEVSSYAENGYCVVPGLFSVEELRDVDTELDRLVDEARTQGMSGIGLTGGNRNKGWLLQLGLRSEITQRFVQDERVLDLIEQIVKPGIAIYSAKLTAKMPQSREICHWHQDNAYYNAHAMSETRMSTWIPLVDVDQDNGCLWVVPGSHKTGVQEHGQYGGQCPQSMGPEDMEAEGAVPCPVKAGSILLFSSDLWHHSKGNQTDQVRRAFIVSYQEATVPRGNADQWEVLRGHRPSKPVSSRRARLMYSLPKEDGRQG
jgi:phytanoyl-CoA hydroxylase